MMFNPVMQAPDFLLRPRRFRLHWLAAGGLAFLLVPMACRPRAIGLRPDAASPTKSATLAPAAKTKRRTPHADAPLPAPAEQMVGTIKTIGAHGSFVLIETPSALITAAVPSGCLLHCHPVGLRGGLPAAELRVSPERRPPFLVADVIAGEATVGDGAYYLPQMPPAPAVLTPASSTGILSAPPTPPVPNPIATP